MSIHFIPKTQRYIIRIRDPEGHNRNITVNTKNLLKYNLHIPNRITERVAKKLEHTVLIQEKVFNGSNHSFKKRNMLWLDVVARYLPPLVDKNGRDTWENRPLVERLENEKTYNNDQHNRMQRVLTVYFPAYLVPFPVTEFRVHNNCCNYFQIKDLRHHNM